MRLPWWPEYVDAKIEEGGIRVLGEQGGVVLPVDALISWPQIRIFYNPIPFDTDGEQMRLDDRKLAFKLVDFKAIQVNKPLRLMSQLAKAWYADPANVFERKVMPKGNRGLILTTLFTGFYGVVCLALPGFWMLRNQFDPTAGTAMTYDLRHVYLILNILAGVSVAVSVVIGIWTVRSTLRIRRSWWLDSVSNAGLGLCGIRGTRRVSWSEVESVSDEFVVQCGVLSGGDRVFWERSPEVGMIIESRLPRPRPKLITAGFVGVILLAALVVPLIGWVYRWLDVPLDDDVVLITGGLMVFLVGMLVLSHIMEIRERRARP